MEEGRSGMYPDLIWMTLENSQQQGLSSKVFVKCDSAINFREKVDDRWFYFEN